MSETAPDISPVTDVSSDRKRFFTRNKIPLHSRGRHRALGQEGHLRSAREGISVPTVSVLKRFTEKATSSPKSEPADKASTNARIKFGNLKESPPYELKKDIDNLPMPYWNKDIKGIRSNGQPLYEAAESQKRYNFFAPLICEISLPYGKKWALFRQQIEENGIPQSSFKLIPLKDGKVVDPTLGVTLTPGDDSVALRDPVMRPEYDFGYINLDDEGIVHIESDPDSLAFNVIANDDFVIRDEYIQSSLTPFSSAPITAEEIDFFDPRHDSARHKKSPTFLPKVSFSSMPPVSSAEGASPKHARLKGKRSRIEKVPV